LVHAITELTHADRAVKEISYMVGYRTPSQLDRQFNDWFHCSPSALREATAVCCCSGIRKAARAEVTGELPLRVLDVERGNAP
jgi:AraC-like DNA-binding protein